MKTEITMGFVMVECPVHDCDGTARTIDFPRLGNVLSGTPNYHWTCKPYVREALAEAKKVLRQRKRMAK